MNKFLAGIFCLSLAIFTACEKAETTKTDTNTHANQTIEKSESTNAPKTEKVDSEYVESESGTEKVKPEAGKANVQGKVLFNEKPAEGIEVRICEKFSRVMGGCDGESFKTKTDANGEYLFANIKPGVYESLMVKVFDTKNYIFAAKNFGISAAKYKFDADKTFFAPDTNLFKDDLKVQNPKPNSKLDVNNLELKWDAYPEAAYYKITLSPKEFDYESSISGEKVEGSTYKPTKPLKPGKYTYSMEAYNANDKKIADMAESVEFEITGGTTSANSNTK